MIVETPLWIHHEDDALSQDGTDAMSDDDDGGDGSAWWWYEPGYFLMENDGMLVAAHNV